MRSATIQISLGIRSLILVFLPEETFEPWLSIEHLLKTEDSRMYMLIRVFNEYTCQLDPFAGHHLYYYTI